VALRKRVSLSEARNIIDWMAKSEEEGGGGRRAEWVSSGGGKGEKNEAWIWWRRPEEWAAVVADWVSGLSLLFFWIAYTGLNLDWVADIVDFSVGMYVWLTLRLIG